MHFIASFLISTIGIKTWQWLILFTNCQTLDPANTEMSKHLFQECIMLSVVIREKAVSFQFLVIYCHAIYLIDFWKFLFSSSSVMGKDEKIDILHLLPYLYVTLRYHGDQMSSCDMSIKTLRYLSFCHRWSGSAERGFSCYLHIWCREALKSAFLLQVFPDC